MNQGMKVENKTRTGFKYPFHQPKPIRNKEKDYCLYNIVSTHPCFSIVGVQKRAVGQKDENKFAHEGRMAVI
jgi:hypothetical protein